MSAIFLFVYAEKNQLIVLKEGNKHNIFIKIPSNFNVGLL